MQDRKSDVAPERLGNLCDAKSHAVDDVDRGVIMVDEIGLYALTLSY